MTGAKILGVVGAGISILILITFLIVGAFVGKACGVASGVIDKVVNPNAIVQNYEWFYDQYNVIQAQKANLDAIPKDSIERSGTAMVLNNEIAEYNSKSRQITRNLWKASNLPYQIDIGENK
jgi:hypothetical protein